MDITPVIPKGRKVIKGYGDMGFKVNDEECQGSIIISEESVDEWDVAAADDIKIETLGAVGDDIEILLIGCGDRHIPLAQEIHAHFSKAGIGVEIMTTGAACRTYNVLLGEGRKVAAALVAV